MYPEMEHDGGTPGYFLIHSTLEIPAIHNSSLGEGRQIYKGAKEVSERTGVETLLH